MWVDNNIVPTLSNYHSPRFLKPGDRVMCQKKTKDKLRHWKTSAVNFPKETKNYTEALYLINYHNLKDLKFDLKGHSKKHN